MSSPTFLLSKELLNFKLGTVISTSLMLHWMQWLQKAKQYTAKRRHDFHIDMIFHSFGSKPPKRLGESSSAVEIFAFGDPKVTTRGTVWSSELLSARWGYEGHAAQQEEHESEESEEQNFQGSSKWRLCKSNCGTVQKSSIPSLCRPKTLVGCRRQHGLVAMADESWWIGFLPILWDSDGPGDSFQHGNHHVWGRSRCTMLSNLL